MSPSPSSARAPACRAGPSPSATVPFTLGSATLTGGIAIFSTTPAAAGTETITIAYGGDADDQPSSVVLPLTVGQATPTLTWADPANITAGTQLGAQLDAIASSGGTPLAGVFTYSPSAGTVLPPGSDQTLTVSFTPTDETDFKTVTASVTINVLPQSTQTSAPSYVMVVGEQPVFERKLNKRGKPVGKPVLTGFTLDFNMPLSLAAVSDPGNYEIDTVTTKKVKKNLDRILKPIKSFTVTYEPANNSVMLRLSNTQTFPTGGQITVLPGVASTAAPCSAVSRSSRSRRAEQTSSRPECEVEVAQASTISWRIDEPHQAVPDRELLSIYRGASRIEFC